MKSRTQLLSLALIFMTLISFMAFGGTNTIPTRSNGQTILPDFFNTVKTALTTNFVPRNASGVATDEAGDLGTDSLRWRDGFYSRYIYVGTAAQQNRITGGTNQLNLQINGVTEVSIGTAGLDGAGVAAGTLSDSAFASNQAPRLRMVLLTSLGAGTWSVPAHVSEVLVYLVGGGGGGGGGAGWNGGSANGGGGGGGSGSIGIFTRLAVTPGGTVSYTVGAGAVGGPGANNFTSGGGGGTGGTTLFGGLQCAGGVGGNGGTTGGVGGAGGSAAFSRTAVGVGGGAGGSGIHPNQTSSAGSNSDLATGGTSAGAANGVSYAGGGGGGAAGYNGNGGAGGVVGGAGVGGSTGSSGSAYGSGGGGGSGSSASGATGGAGGSGGNGMIKILYIGPE